MFEICSYQILITQYEIGNNTNISIKAQQQLYYICLNIDIFGFVRKTTLDFAFFNQNERMPSIKRKKRLFSCDVIELRGPIWSSG